MSTLLKIFFALMVVGLISAGAFVLWFQSELEPVSPSGGAQPQAYRVDPGATLGRVAADL